MTIAKKSNPICPKDTGYMDSVIIDGIEWYKCPICGTMRKA